MAVWQDYQPANGWGNGNALLPMAKYLKGLLDAPLDSTTLFKNHQPGAPYRRVLRAGSIEAKQVFMCPNAFIPPVRSRDSGTFS